MFLKKKQQIKVEKHYVYVGKMEKILYLFYNQDITICQQLVGKLGEEVFFSVPWGHHI